MSGGTLTSAPPVNQHGYRCGERSPDDQLLVQLRPVLHRQRPLPQDVEEVDLLFVLPALVWTLEGPRWKHRGEAVKHIIQATPDRTPVRRREYQLFIAH